MLSDVPVSLNIFVKLLKIILSNYSETLSETSVKFIFFFRRLYALWYFYFLGALLESFWKRCQMLRMIWFRSFCEALPESSENHIADDWAALKKALRELFQTLQESPSNLKIFRMLLGNDFRSFWKAILEASKIFYRSFCRKLFDEFLGSFLIIIA